MKSSISSLVRQFARIIHLFKSNESISKYPRAQKLTTGMEDLQETMLPLYNEMQKQDTYHNEMLRVAIDQVCSIGYPLGKAVEDIALQKGNTLLATSIHTSYVMMTRKGGDNLYGYASKIVKAAEEVVVELADYNKGAQSITDLKDAMVVLKKANESLKTYTEEQQARSTQLDDMAKQAKGLLNSCGLFMETIRLEEPVAYKAYQEERKMPESGSVQSNIRIYDDFTKEPVLEAKVEVYSTTRIDNGAPLKVLERTTGVNGELRIAKLDYDIYEVVATKTGHEPLKAKMLVADSRTVRMDLYLKPLELN